MFNFFLKYCVVSLITALFFGLSTTSVFATRTIDSATLNGGSSVSVAPSTSITTVVNVTTISGGGGPNWQSTSWTLNGSTTCVDHSNHNTTGSFSESFSITAPASVGTYNVSFIAYSNNTCVQDPSLTYTLTNGITVAVATPTPSPTPTPTPGSTTTPVPTSVASSTPTPTPTPTTTSSDSTSTTSYAPTVTLHTYTPNPTRIVPLTLSGTTSIEQGTVASVEYTLTEGASWIPAQLNGSSFRFTTPNLAEGKYTVKVRAKSEAGIFTPTESYASQLITIATTPPKVTLDPVTPNPTKNQTPLLKGTVFPKLVSIAKIEISIDGGKSWLQTKHSKNVFSLALSKLEDGNYPTLARAYDSAGNVGQSESQTLIVDTIPPIIGGGMQSMGPQVLSPNKKGTVSVLSGIDTIIAMSMKGGITAATIESAGETFPLSLKQGTNIWAGKAIFTADGEKPLTVVAVDGAGNRTTRKFNTLSVQNSGTLIDKNTLHTIENAQVSLYFFDSIYRQWILWEASSYGQQNPQRTDAAGSYSFMVPEGKYYIDIKAPGYRESQSKIITAVTTSILNYSIPLTPAPKIEFQLPVFGKIAWILPSIFPPISFQTPVNIGAEQTEDTNTLVTNNLATDFILPNLKQEDVSLSSYAGKKLLLTFIASWSSLSLEQASFLSEVSAKLTEDQELLVVSLQESTAATQILMNQGKYTFPVVSDVYGNIAASYNITLLPHHVFIDKNSRIQETYTGVQTAEELLERLATIQ